MTQCPLLTDRGIGAISTRCELMKNLHISGLPNITDEASQHLVCEPLAGDARGMNLIVLNLSFCTTLTNRSVELIAKACKKLGALSLAHQHLNGCLRARSSRPGSELNESQFSSCSLQPALFFRIIPSPVS